MQILTPHLEILPPSQLALWYELFAVPKNFILYGGTAAALHLGHRQSVDFDFFTFENFSPQHLYTTLPFLKGSEILQQEKNTLTCLVTRQDPVKVSFFGLPNLKSITPPHQVAEINLQIASLIDLAGMKAAVVQQRAEQKDYIDLDAIMQHGISLTQALVTARSIYGAQFNPQITLKALSFFDDGDLTGLSVDIRHRLLLAVRGVNLVDLALS